MQKKEKESHHAKLPNSSWHSEILRSLIYVGVLPVLWRLITNYLGSVVGIYAVFNALSDAKQDVGAFLSELQYLFLKLTTTLLMLLSTAPALFFALWRFSEIQHYALELSGEFIQNRISKQPFRPLIAFLEVIIWFICISSFISYKEVMQYTFTTSCIFFVVDFVGCHATAIGLCVINDLMASHPIFLEQKKIFTFYGAMFIWSLQCHVNNWSEFYYLVFIFGVFIGLDFLSSSRSPKYHRILRLVALPTLSSLSTLDLDIKNFHQVAVSFIFRLNIKVVPSLGYVPFLATSFDICTATVVKVSTMQIFGSKALPLEKIHFRASTNYLSNLYLIYLRIPYLVFKKTFHIMLRILGFLEDTRKSRWRNFKHRIMNIFESIRRGDALGMFPALLLIISALVLWIYSERAPASEVLTQLGKNGDFLIKREGHNRTYLSCSFSKNDTGIIRPQSIHRYAALSDIVYGNVSTVDSSELENLLGLKKLNDTVILDDEWAKESRRINTQRYDIWEDDEVVVMSFRGTWDWGDWLIDWNIISGTLGMHMFIQSLPFSLPYHIMMHDITIANLEESLHGKLVDPLDMYFQKTFISKDHELYNRMKRGISDYARNKQKPLILTGHSLGGMIAQVMATQIALESFQNVTAVVFNSPGLKWSQFYLATDHNILMQHSINVNTKYDPVSIVDEPRGSVFLLRCPSGFAGCHSMTYVLCELWRSCDDNYPRFCEDVLPKTNLREMKIRLDLQALNLTIKYLTKFIGVLIILFVNYWHETLLFNEEKKDRSEKTKERDERVLNYSSSEITLSDNSKTAILKKNRKPKHNNEN